MPYTPRACQVTRCERALRGFQRRADRRCPRRAIPPQGDHEFARQRDNPDASQPGGDRKVLKPSRQGTLGLPPDPLPRQLNADGLEPSIAGATDPLLVPRLAALKRRRRETEQPANLPAIPKLPPD